MIDGTCAHGEELTDGCEDCNDAVKARAAIRPTCPLGVTEGHFCDAVTCNTPVERLRREAVVSRDLTRRLHAVASKHVAMLWSLDAAQAVEKLLGLLIEHGAVLRRFVNYANGKGPSIDSAYLEILDAALALIQRMPVGISVTEQSYRAQCAALEKAVAQLFKRCSEAERERDEARVASIHEARVAVRIIAERDALAKEAARLQQLADDREGMVNELLTSCSQLKDQQMASEADASRDALDEALEKAVRDVHFILDGGGIPEDVDGDDSFVTRTKLCVDWLKSNRDKSDRLHEILTAAREALNGGESSEGDFAEHLAQHMKVCTAQRLQLREDVDNWQKRAEALTAELDEANRLLGEAAEALNRVVTERDIARDEKAEPVPMILSCPECCERHIDAGEWAEKPHHTHACQSCGFVWRPAVVATVGVRFLPGFRDADVVVASSRFGMSTANIHDAEPEPS